MPRTVLDSEKVLRTTGCDNWKSLNPTEEASVSDIDLYDVENRERFFNIVYHSINEKIASGQLRAGRKIKFHFCQKRFAASKKYRHNEQACVQELSKEFDAYMRRRVPWYRRHYQYLTWHWVRDGEFYTLMLRLHVFPTRLKPRK